MASIVEMRDIGTRLREVLKGEIRFDEPLSRHTTLRIGGPADIMVFPDGVMALKDILHFAKLEGVSVFVIGNGSNLLVSDSGLRGIVISLRSLRNIESIKEMDDDVILSAGAGVTLSSLINYAKRHGYSGIEELSGIPGTLGGAIYTNAGSFGREIKDVIVSVTIMDRAGDMRVLQRDEIRFTYRGSNLSDDLIIVNAWVRLIREDEGIVKKRISEFLQRKADTQPIAEPSAGCVFKNPEGDSAGRLIDSAGCKGMRIGDIEVSSMHANYFLNKGNGTCRDFMRLMKEVRERVRVYSGVELEPEIKIVGDY